MVEVGAFLYIADNSRTNEIYIGIGESTTRIHQAHNSEAEKLIQANDTNLLQTVHKFSSVQDARMAEAIAIHIAARAGKKIILDEDDDLKRVDEEQEAVLTPTNRAATKSSRYLVPVIPRKDGVVTYSSLTNTAIVTIKPEDLSDGTNRGTVHGGKTAQELAARVLGEWDLNTSRIRGYKITRLIARMKTSSVIIADWDLNPDQPTKGDFFNPFNRDDIDPRGTRGMILDMESRRLSNTVTYSQDIPVSGR